MPGYIDVNLLKERMYHEAFEKTTDMQRWDSGCWIRYKLFENVVAGIQPADVVERKDLDKITEAHEEIGYEKGYRDGCAQATVEVVRCKECKHYKPSEADPNRKMCWRKDVDGFPVCYDFYPTDHCSYGERREDG